MEVEEDKCLINGLPDDLLMFCLLYLDVDHLLHQVPQVCSRWDKVAREKYIWKRKRLDFDGRQWNDETYVKDFVKMLDEVPCLGILDLSGVPIEIDDVASQYEMQPRMTPVTQYFPNESGAIFQRSIGLSYLKSDAYFEGLPDLLRANRETLISVALHDVQLGSLNDADFYELENIKLTLSKVMEALQGCKFLRHLSLEFSDVWEHGVFREWYEEMDRIVYTSVLQISSLERLQLICARPLIGKLSSPHYNVSWQLKELEIVGESYFNDELSALLVSAATGTLQLFNSDGGPRTLKALGRCQNLQVLELPSLSDIHYLKNLKSVYSLKIFSLKESDNKNVNVQYILESPLLKNLRKLSLRVTGDLNVADFILAIFTQCQWVKTLIVYESKLPYPLRPRQFISLAPLIVKSIVDGAMPELSTFDVHSWAHLEWKEPLRALIEHRPKLHVLPKPYYSCY